MTKKIGLVHATVESIQPIVKYFNQYAPEITLTNFVDEGLLQAALQEGKITPDILRSFVGLVGRAVESGVDGVLFTCSVFSASTPVIAPLFSVPVRSTNNAMFEQAATMKKIVVMATVASSAYIGADEIKQYADKLTNNNIEIEVVAVDGAFEALCAGDGEKHDRLVEQKVKSISLGVDAIVFTQVSMTRATKVINSSIPILTSPEISIKDIVRRVTIAN